jgi:mono/diheme cytochrome c family protein
MIRAVLIAAAVVGVVLTAAAVWYARSSGLTALGQPNALETRVARTVRHFAVPGEIRERQNPIPVSDDVIASGRAHFADHCASCHANDGSGNATMGRNLFPRAPDMRQTATQSLTDGELFWIIEYGIRFTGMPGWSTGTEDGATASWHLVHFIRRLPNISEAELEGMEAMNPRSPAEIRQEIDAERFLRGEDVTAKEPASPSHAH